MVLSVRTCVGLFGGACLGGLLFGYDTGVISGVLLSLQPGDLYRTALSNADRELITSATGVGSLVGSLAGAPVAERYGRKACLRLCSILFVLSSVWLSTAQSLSWLVCGRFFVGIAVGLAAQCTPVYLSEVSPKTHNGAVLTLNVLAITAGQFLAYIIALFVCQYWRWLFLLSAIPAIAFLLLLQYVPESPRWLISRGLHSQALAELSVIYPVATSDQLSSMLGDLAAHSQNSKIVMSPGHTQALVGGCILMAFQQLSGFNAFMYYSTLIFQKIGIKNPLWPAMVVAGTNLLFTIVAFSLLDIVGKRKMLLYTIWIMIVGLILCSLGFSRDNSSLTMVSTAIYVAGYASAMGTVPWSSVEFLPTKLRASAGSSISCVNWLTNTLVSFTYLSILDKIGGTYIMLIFTCFTLLNWIFVYIWYPETKGLSLEEIDILFNKKYSYGSIQHE